jgi:hypothetical protein
MAAFDPRVDDSKLRELLEDAHESDSVEYVSDCDLNERHDVVELASEIGARGARRLPRSRRR